LLERWRRPVVPLDISEQPDQGFWLPDGRRLGGATFALKPEDISRMRAGYVCAKCFEPFERAWPERCNFCGAPVRTEQAAYFAREYGGEERLHQGVDLNEELGTLEERARKEEEKR
jgi:hypothetical protein